MAISNRILIVLPCRQPGNWFRIRFIVGENLTIPAKIISKGKQNYPVVSCFKF
jgi:hypothetical protein